ncbi:sorting nexin-12-like [Lytechinus variegatus]|uniref:sorting nexin-12-like n=1 Tax=Lytechinus variegatus TaxID=7654 RepID=UPI001BB22CB2|nr:sorting nexin-12-like [Lytechinus variegatus]
MLKDSGSGAGSTPTTPVDISNSEMEQGQSEGNGSPVGSPELDTSMSLASSSCCSGSSSDIASDSSLHFNDLPVHPVNRISQVQTILEVSEMISSTDSMGSKVTLYKISIESNDICFHLPSSCVWRTYAEFVWLRKRLESGCSFIRKAVPELPSRTLLNLFDKDFAEKRKIGLEDFLNKVLMERSFLSDAAVHLFLQSNLSTDEIQAWLDRKADGTILELIHRGKDIVMQDYDALTPQEV